MLRDEFKVEFKRLCDGFSYQPRPAQVEAFYERLQHCHWHDWHEAVTDLLCAPMFPKTLELILEAVERRAEQRRRSTVHREQYQAQQTMTRLGTGMWEALADKPELLDKMQKFMGKAKGAA